MRVLTKARAKVVRDYLVQNFEINDKHVETLGLGKMEESGRPSSVAILVYPAEKSVKQSADLTTQSPQPKP
jgi:hypothetical protein